MKVAGTIVTSLLGLCGACLAASSSIESSVSISGLEQCLAFGSPEIVRTDRMEKLMVEASVTRHPGDCGCISKLLEYRVLENVSISGGSVAEYERVYAIVVAPNVGSKKELAFLLSSDPDLTYQGQLRVELSCKAPD